LFGSVLSVLEVGQVTKRQDAKVLLTLHLDDAIDDGRFPRTGKPGKLDD
jgi:hypothetical protein